mgnify:CR=1 FL=1
MVVTAAVVQPEETMVEQTVAVAVAVVGGRVKGDIIGRGEVGRGSTGYLVGGGERAEIQKTTT